MFPIRNHYYGIVLLVIVCATWCITATPYTPDWKSLDSRPLPDWYDNAKVGIILHWGVYSVPSYHSEWFWYYWVVQQFADIVNFMKRNYAPNFTYFDFARQFQAELFDPDQWAKLFNDSGAKYVVLTSKHHDGFCLWPTNHSFNWNAHDIGPRRDLLGDLIQSLRKYRKDGLHYGVYHSLFEWFHPLYHYDSVIMNFTTQHFVKEKVMPELLELIHTYEPDVLWSDGDAGPTEYWQSKEFLAWLYSYSSVRNSIVTNDRWGTGTSGKHGDFFNTMDRYNPGTLQKHKWENAFTIDRASWGYRRNANLIDYMSIEAILLEVVSTVSCGGNALINVGPTSDGRILPIFEERLRQLGHWLKINGEAIYFTQPWKHQNDSSTEHVWYTTSKLTNGTVYAILLSPLLPTTKIYLGSVQATAMTSMTILGRRGSLMWRQESPVGVTVFFDSPTALPYAWTVKMTNIH